MDEDSVEGHQNGKPRRHDGKDPWSFVPRERVFAELASVTSASPNVAIDAPAPGDTVAVIIERERLDTQGRHEEIWLEVEGVDGDVITATFDSQPTYVRGVSSGDRVTLSLTQVVAVRRRRA